MKRKPKIYARSRLRIERLTQGWQMEDFARRIGISRAALSGLELRRWGTSERVAINICKTLHKDFEELFEYVIDPAAEEQKDANHIAV